jgi:chromosome segregation protein
METRKNLIRLEDISQTLETQLQHLQAQAEIAQHYRSLQEKLHLLQSLLWVQRRNDALSQRTNAEQEIQKLEVALEVALSKQHHAEKEYETMRETEYAVSDKLLQVQGQLYTVNAEIGRLKQEINHLKNNSERLVQQIQEIEHRLEKNNRQEEIAQKNLLHWRQEKINAESAHAESALRNDQFSKELPITEANFIRCQEALEKCRHSLLMTEQVNQLENNHLAHAAKNIQQLEARHSRLLKEQSELVASDSSLLAERQLEMDQAECALKEHSLKHQDSEHRLSAAILHKQQVTDKVQELQHSLSQATARFSALQNLQQKLENNQDLAIWLNKHQLDGLPRLWQHMQIQPEW